MRNIKAIIFDMDGVISDTQRLHTRIEREVFAEYGIDITEKEIAFLYAGTKDITQFTNEFKKHSVHANPEEAYMKKWEKMKKIKNSKINAIPGIIRLIDSLGNNYKLAVASGSSTDFVESILKILKIRDKFIAISGGDLVEEGKPSPALFLLAAKQLGIDPIDCTVIEDAPNGVKAAKSAGMKCIGITTTHTASELKGADLIINSFDELTPDIIQEV